MTSTPTLIVPAPDAGRLRVPVRGTAPLLMHRFSEKARKIMLDATQGKKNPREPKDPEAEYLASIYHTKDGGYGFPAVGFKAATVSAARIYDKRVTMAALRQALFFTGEPGDDGSLMVRIEGEPVMREDVCRVGNGGTDLRYRAQFTEWSATLDVTFIRGMVSTESVLSLIEAGGLAVGVGDWRPERSGTFGTYTLDRTRDVEVGA